MGYLTARLVSLALPFCFPLSWVLSLKLGYSPRVGRTGTKALTIIAGQGAKEEGQADVKEQEGSGASLWRAGTGIPWEGVLANIEF